MGFYQQLGFDYTKKISPVVKLVTMHLILTLTLTYHWTIHQLDVNAFLNGLLEEEVYMQQPLGFEHIDKTQVYKSNKVIYRLK